MVLAKGKEGAKEGGQMEMPLIRGKLSINMNPTTITTFQNSKEEKGLRMPIKRRKPMDIKKHSCAQVDLS